MRITRLQIDTLAAAIAEAQDSTRPADVLLHHFFRAHPELGARDRSVVAEGFFAWLRRRRSLEMLADSQHPLLLALATLVRDQGHSVRELGPLLSDNEGAWLEEFKSRRVELPPAVAHDVPDWLWERLGQVITDEERSAMTRAWLNPAPLDIRINPLKTKREAVQEELARAGITAVPTPYSPLGLRIEGRPALNRLPSFENGNIEVQDEGSQLLALLVAPTRNEMVVDFCAGAGGKTLLLGALMHNQGRLYAFDTSEKRLSNLKPRLKRSGLSNIHPQLIAHENDAKIKRLAGKIDRVLIDAPCSGLGTLRRNPDLKWRQSHGDRGRTVRQTTGHSSFGRAFAQSGRPAGVRDMQHAARGKPRRDRRVSGAPSGLPPGAGQGCSPQGRPVARYGRLSGIVTAPARLRWLFRGDSGAAARRRPCCESRRKRRMSDRPV